MFENLPHSRQVYQSKQDHLERKRSSARRSVIQIERGEREKIIRIVSGAPLFESLYMLGFLFDIVLN